MEKRTTIRLDAHALQVIERAACIWGEHAWNQSELIRQILADWNRLRDDERTGSRAQTAERLERIEEMLGILMEMMTNDYDHA